MGNRTEGRVIALVGVVSALLPAVQAVAGLAALTSWYPGGAVLMPFAVVAGACAVVVGVAARRSGDRASLAFATSVVLSALGWVPLPSALWPIGAVLQVASQALLIAFGVLVLRRGAGPARVGGWVVTIGAAVWLLGGVAPWAAVRWGAPQELIGTLFLVAPLGALVGFVASAVLFAGPLLRPVGAGARYLWSTADVR